MKFPIKFARSIVVFAFLAGISANALESKKYVIFKTPTSNVDNLLIEIFSYYCKHCYDYHKFNIMGKVEEKLPNLTYKFYAEIMENFLKTPRL